MNRSTGVPYWMEPGNILRAPGRRVGFSSLTILGSLRGRKRMASIEEDWARSLEARRAEARLEKVLLLFRKESELKLGRSLSRLRAKMLKMLFCLSNSWTITVQLAQTTTIPYITKGSLRQALEAFSRIMYNKRSLLDSRLIWGHSKGTLTWISPKSHL
jgi:hypothetical protein